MKTPASIANHPIHPMLITIPIGLWLFSLVCDLVALSRPEGPWPTLALYTLAGGILGALLAAVPGLIDMLSLAGRRRKVALVHMTINLTVVALYVINFWLRTQNENYDSGGAPLLLSVVAVVLLAMSGWLGGKLVYELGVAVDGRPYND
ncbi:MAG TPA: DUF2231 domain-containing protein [Burkholderiales bacterium]|nr:DUF2231 domain-containing protein [Burkholderiales bacterium]